MKPRIFKRKTYWVLECPPYGFSTKGQSYTFTTWRNAIRWAGRRGGASAGQLIGTNTQPPRVHFTGEGLRPVIR